jgi:hypothetical protein
MTVPVTVALAPGEVGEEEDDSLQEGARRRARAQSVNETDRGIGNDMRSSV